MIANTIAFGSSFQANIHYNMYGNKAEPNPHKCAWHVARNMFTDDLDAAGTIMEATASRSRTDKPSYHFSIDWDRSEERFLNPEKCTEAADAILDKIGLKDHQALYFWHVDANHPHMHVVVNRVHEDTGKAWDMWKSKERLERATHEVAKEMEFLQVPGRHNDMDFEASKSKDAPKSREERATEPELSPWVKEKIPDVKAEIGNAFYHANSWEELSGTLSEAGYELRTKGQGMIITDGTNYTQLSKMGKHVRLNALEEKFGEKFGEHKSRDPLEPVDEHSPVESFDNLPEAIDKKLQQKVEDWDNLPDPAHYNEEPPKPSDSQARMLLTVLDEIDTFEKGWTVQKSANNIMYLREKIERQSKYLTRAKDLARYHDDKGMELILAFDKKFDDDKGQTVEDKLKATLREINRQKTPRWKLIVKGLKKRLKTLQVKRRKRKKQKKEWEKKREWQIYYRLQKIREAQSRITAKKMDVNQSKATLKNTEKAHAINNATRDHLLSTRRSIVKNLSKEAIINASIPMEQKKRLFSAWYGEQERQAANEKDNNRDIDRDDFER